MECPPLNHQCYIIIIIVQPKNAIPAAASSNFPFFANVRRETWTVSHVNFDFFLLLCIFRHFTLSVFNCMLPGTMVLVLGFFAILHSWLNAFAEMTRFADRMFYEVSKNHLTVSANWNVNTLHPNISMHILHTVLHTSPLLLTRRICVLVKSVLTW